MRSDLAGSGTFAVDAYRDIKAREAECALATGTSGYTLTGDHTTGELCIETIARLKNDTSKRGAPTQLQFNATLDALTKLRQGFGQTAVAGTHSGGNTCAQVIAAATT